MATVVIGGGIAGLTAAYELIKRGERPVILEPHRIGGMISSSSVNGFTLERGPNVLVERPDLMKLLGELGIQDRVVYPSVKPYGQYVWHRDRPAKVPAGLTELLGTPLIPLRDKLLLPARLLAPGVLRPNGEDESVYTFFSRLIGGYATQAMLDPVLKGIYGGDVGALSARSLFRGLWDAAVSGRSVVQYMRQRSKGGKPSILVIRGGIDGLTRALWDKIAPDVEYVAEGAQEISKGGEGMYNVVTSSGRTIVAERCVVAIAGESLARLFERAHPRVAQQLSAMQYASLTVMHLAVPRSDKLIKDAFGVLCPGGMPENFLGVMFNSQIFPSVAPSDKHLITVILGGAQAGHESPEAERIKRTIPELLNRFFSISEAQVVGVTHWPRAIPQLQVGHYRVVESLDALEKEWSGFVCVGVDRGGVGVSDRIRLAREGVERLMERGSERRNYE